MSKSPSPRPLSIKVIAIFYGLNIPAMIITVFSEQSTILGQFIYGPVTYLVNLVVLLIIASIAIGLWRLNELTRRVTIAWLLYGVLNSFLLSINPVYHEIFTEAFAQANLDPSLIDSMTTTSAVIINVVSLIFSSVIIGFLIKRKSAFIKKPAT